MSFFLLALSHKYFWGYASFFIKIYSSHNRKQIMYSLNKERAQARTQHSQLLPYMLWVTDIVLYAQSVDFQNC